MSTIRQPIVKLISYTSTPTKTIIASGRSCMKETVVNPNKIILPDEIDSLKKGEPPEEQDKIDRRAKWNLCTAKGTFNAGHHTLLEHVYFTFELDNISRQLIWSFLHSFPFYNSSERSQRYVVFKEKKAFIPKKLQNNKKYEKAVNISWEAYEQLTKLLVNDIVLILKKLRNKPEEDVQKEALKRAIEIARYILPQSTLTGMVHTINGITLKRLQSAINFGDVPEEAKIVVEQMLNEVEKVDPYFNELKTPLFKEDQVIENALVNKYSPDKESIKKFKAELDGRRSKLLFSTPDAEAVLAKAARRVLSLSDDALTDEEMISYILNPAKNPYLLETVNLSLHSPLMRALHEISYTFAKRISLSGDAQNKRHRFALASRPLLKYVIPDEPDVVTPILIQNNQEAKELFDKTIKYIWSIRNELIADGCSSVDANYLLPNATAIYYYENNTLLNLIHRFKLRLCNRAQMEIYLISREEIVQINKLHPNIGKWLGPTCTLRCKASKLPYCPEGSQWCGYKTWELFPDVDRQL